MLSAIFVIFNLFILESLLSIDNAAVLSLMVKDLPTHDQSKALKYGIGGAFLFRGLSLFVVSWLIHILWLKIIGGIYLLYLVYGHFTATNDTLEEGIDKHSNKLYIKLSNKIGVLWATICLVEFMDMAFSIDNIFASVAMTSNIYLILTGVFIGIIAMRFVAQWFAFLINKFPSLEQSAFIVIGLLGFKLIVSGITVYYKSTIGQVMNNQLFDLCFSSAMLIVFFTPILLQIKIKHDALQKI